MTAVASSPGKAILCGEHAVVYGQPAIALPITAVAATAVVRAARRPGITIRMPDIGRRVHDARIALHPLVVLAHRTFEHLQLAPVNLDITLRSTIPIASGMGSGAALGAALVRGIAAHVQRSIEAAAVSELVYESERFYHGTPSGIDNTVVSYAQPVWYQRSMDGGAPHLEPLRIGTTFHLVIADTGVRAPTRLTVAGVRERWSADPDRYQAWFDQIGQITQRVRGFLQAGDAVALGSALNENQRVLECLGVSSPELDRLVGVARDAGALGAKLSGGGGGGIMLALTHATSSATVAASLQEAGATRVIESTLSPTAVVR